MALLLALPNGFVDAHTFCRLSMQKVAMGKVYDAQRQLKATPTTLGEALAFFIRQHQQLARDSLRELEEAVRRLSMKLGSDVADNQKRGKRAPELFSMLLTD